MSELIVRTGKHEGQRLVLAEAEVLVGRGEDCHVRLGSADISKRHCLIKVTPKGMVVRDLDSRNGTYVNDMVIRQETLLGPGDRLRVGPMVFQVPHATLETAQTGASPQSASDDAIVSWLSDDALPSTGSHDTTITRKAAPASPAPVAAPTPAAASAGAGPSRKFRSVAEEAADIIRRWRLQTEQQPQ